MKKLFPFLAALFAAGALRAQPAPAPGKPSSPPNPPASKILYVDPTQGEDRTAVRGSSVHPFATLASAVSAAQAGDKITLLPGHYRVSGIATVNAADLTIEGYGAVLTAAGQEHFQVLAIKGANCTLRGFEINGALDNAPDVDAGAITVGAGGAKIEDVYIHDCAGYGVRLVAKWDGAVVSHCRIERCNEGVAEAIYGGADIEGLEVSFNRLIDNRRGGVRGENNSVGKYAIRSEKIIGNVVLAHSPNGTLGIELWGGGIAGYAKIPHQDALVSLNTVSGYSFGISMNACGNCTVSDNIVARAAAFGIEFANSFGNTAANNRIDCAGGHNGYSVSNNGNDTGRSVDLHIMGGSVFNANLGDALKTYNVSHVTIDGVHTEGLSHQFLVQLCTDIMIQNCVSYMTGTNYAGGVGVFTEVDPGLTGSTFHYVNNQFFHPNGRAAVASIFKFFSNGHATANDIVLRDNFTDATFCGGGFVAGNLDTHYSQFSGNYPDSKLYQTGFLNTPPSTLASQPSPPPAPASGVTLYVDGNGDLHALHSSGADHVLSTH